MKKLFLSIVLTLLTISLVGCTGIYENPGYPVVSSGGDIHQRHYRYRDRPYANPRIHQRHYRRRYKSYANKYGPRPSVHTSERRISQNHY